MNLEDYLKNFVALEAGCLLDLRCVFVAYNSNLARIYIEFVGDGLGIVVGTHVQLVHLLFLP